MVLVGERRDCGRNSHGLEVQVIDGHTRAAIDEEVQNNEVPGC